MKTRIYFLLVFGLFFFQSKTHSQDNITRLNNILILEGSDLFKAFEDYRYSDWEDDLPNKKQIKNKNSFVDTLALYWRALDKALNSKPKSFEDGYDAASFIEEIVYSLLINDRSNAYSKISTIYKNLSDSSQFKDEYLLIPLCNYYIFSELNRLVENNIPPSTTLIKIADKNFEIPISKYKNDFVDEALLYKSLENHYKQRINKDTTGNWYYVQKNYNSFIKLLEEILFADSPDHMKNLLKFEWGGWCGTGSEGFDQQREIGLLILLLREKDYYAILGSSQLTNHLNQTALRERVYISGLNWIDLSIGAILNGDVRFLNEELTEYGGNAVAQKLIMLNDYNFNNIYNKINYLKLCANFLDRKKTVELSFFWYNESPLWQDWKKHFNVSYDEVSQKQKDTLEEIIIKSVEDSDNLDICQFAIRSLNQFKFNERIKSVLLTYTKSKFSQVKEGAARILKQNGITINLPKDNGLLTFKLLVDNKALSNYNLYWEIFGDSSNDSHLISSNRKTDENGFLNLPRDLVLSTNKKIQRIRLSSGMFGDEKKDLLFFYDTQMPANYLDTTIINIPTSKVILNFKLNRDPKFYDNKKSAVYLSTYTSSYSLSFSCEVKDTILFLQKIQKGQKYYMSVDIPGSERWSDFFEIQNDTHFVDIELKHGTNVILEIVAPGVNQADDDVMFDIIKNDSLESDYFFSPYDYELKGYQSLPIGKYTLKILSSEEKATKIASGEWGKNEILPDFEPYEGKEIKFTITEDSPEIIDLGIIKLEPVNK